MTPPVSLLGVNRKSDPRDGDPTMDGKLVKAICAETGLNVRTVRSALRLREHPTGTPRLSTVRTVQAALLRVTSRQGGHTDGNR